jgi:hypothetical protein
MKIKIALRIKSLLKSLLYIAFHPLFIALFVSAVIIILFFPETSKYVIEQVDQSFHTKTALIYYDDMDSNGYSDQVLVSTYMQEKGLTAVVVQQHPGVKIKEWDFYGNCTFDNCAHSKKEYRILINDL